MHFRDKTHYQEVLALYLLKALNGYDPDKDAVSVAVIPIRPPVFKAFMALSKNPIGLP